MQQRQLRLGDILDDYCPRERRLTNHAVVAMIDDEVKQTRCTTCDTEHEFKHARIPRQRRKSETPAALYSQVAANGPKRVAHDPAGDELTNEANQGEESDPTTFSDEEPGDEAAIAAGSDEPAGTDDDEQEPEDAAREHGPVHRPLIRASLPRQEGQQPPPRPIPEFTIRQPTGGRAGRFRPRGPRAGGGQPFNNGGNRSNGNFAGPPRGMRQGGGRPPQGGGGGMARRHGPPGGGRKRSK